MTTPIELHAEMEDRCHQVWVFHREGQDEDAASNAVGALLQTVDGGVMAVEVALTPGGLATVTARAFNEHGDATPLGVLEMEYTVMITA